MKKNKEKKKYKKLIPILIIITVMVIGAGFGYVVYMQNKLDKESSTSSSIKYKSHYVMISEDMSSDFWQSVFSYAKKYADSKGIYIETVGENLSDSYSMEDYLRISIASDVDGIIISPDGTDEVNDLIDKAIDRGIPVVTILNDEPDTKRVSFVGINTYQMGQLYASQIEALINKKTKKIYVLLDDEKSATTDVVFNQIKSKILYDKRGVRNIEVDPYYIKNSNPFDTEESIRNIFVNTKKLPDVMVCLNETDAECACQATIDYNQVGNVKLVAYYSSDIILNAIKKNIVSRSIELDAKELGNYSVQALSDYKSTGYVSDYISVDMNVISLKNVDKFY